jgi:hypothetical protein
MPAPWMEYFLAFVAGLFLANAVPHFVQGICGNRFPTPFAKPPGKGLSSPTVNVVWGIVNLVIGYLALTHSGISRGAPMQPLMLLLGIVAISIPMSVRFAKREKE